MKIGKIWPGMDPRGVQMDNPFINSMQETTYNGLTDTTTDKTST